jgi:iron complex transport system permease protein
VSRTGVESARGPTASQLRASLILLILAIILVAAAVLALSVGAADTTATIIREIRAPRIAVAIAVGAGLGISGALLQGVLRNPLADPGIIGVSAAAALGSVIVVAVGAAYASIAVGIGGVIGGILAMALVVWIARGRDGTEIVTLILAGVAITAFAAAILSVVIASLDIAGARTTTFWTTGSLALANWASLWIITPFIVAALSIGIALARRIDVMSLGDRAAHAAGVDVRATRWWALSAAVLAVGAGVAIVGVIAFVGLVVPHAIRALLGPRHNYVIFGSALAGALLLLIADTIARSIVSPIELPIGVVTALIGAPIFVLLLRRTRARQGGWA